MNRYLATYGWLPWGEVVQVMGPSVRASWLEPAALHQESQVPGVLPQTQRIHAWSTADAPLWRLLVNSERGLVLCTGLSQRQDGFPRKPKTRAVEVDEEAGDGWVNYLVMGPAPLLFRRPSAKTVLQQGASDAS